VPAPGDNQVLPVFWSDNDITLWPGESQTLRATYRRSALHGASPVVSVFGWNVPAVDVPAP
jgi:exo-1,4-beta-D-glucosaminidase